MGILIFLLPNDEVTRWREAQRNAGRVHWQVGGLEGKDDYQ
jgi:hypothetical protein